MAGRRQSRKGNLILKRKVQTVAEYIESFRQTGSKKRFSNLYTNQNQESQEYLKKLKEVIEILQQTYDEYIEQYKLLMSVQESMNANNDVFSQLTQVLSNEKNAASLLLNNSALPQNFTDQILINYDNAYQNFYNAFINAKQFLDSINGTIRDEINEMHIGVFDAKNEGFKEFWLDNKSMAELESFESGLLKLNITKGKNGEFNATLALKRNLSNDELINGLTKAMNASAWSVEQSNLMNSNWQDNTIAFNILRRIGLVSQRQGQKGTQKLDKGRIYEVLEKVRGYGANVLEDIMSHGYQRDTISWLAQGDYSYIDDNGMVHQAQDKLISINNFYGMGRINLGNIRQMFQAFTVLSNPQQVLSRWNSFEEQRWNNLGNRGVLGEINRWGADNIKSMRDTINSGIDYLFGLFTVDNAQVTQTGQFDEEDIY